MTAFLQDVTAVDLTHAANLLQQARRTLRQKRIRDHVASEQAARQQEQSYEKVETVLRRLASAKGGG